MQKYFFTLLISFLACSFAAVSQPNTDKLNIDSLRKVLLTAKDTQQINTLNLLTKRMIFGPHEDSDIDTALSLALKAQALSKNLHYGKGLGTALLNQGLIINIFKSISTNSNNILSLLQTALPLLKQSGDKYLIADCFSMIARAYQHLGENNNAIIYFDSSIHLYQEIGDTDMVIWKTIDKVHSYRHLGNYAASYSDLHHALELIPKNDTVKLSQAYVQMAQLFVFAKLPETAIEYINKIQAFYPPPAPGNRKHLPWTLLGALRVEGEAFLLLNQIDSALKIEKFINISFEEQDPPDNLFYGHLYSAMGQYEKAIIYFTQGFNVSQRTSYGIGHSMHASGLASAYLKLKKFQKAIHYAKEAEKISAKTHILSEQKNAVGILSEIYAATKNYTKAYKYNQLYKALSDSLLPEEYKQKLSLIQVKDQLEMQKKEAQLLSDQNQINRQQIKLQESSLKRRELLLYIFIGALLMMGLLAIFVNRNIKLKKKKAQLQQLMEQVNAQQKLTELEKEKANLEMQALRAQMNPHFIFNCLSSINRFILINKVEEASDYLTKFSRVIRMALNNSEKQQITLENELEALRLYLDLERLRFKNSFDYSITFINTIDSNTVYIPPMLIQPFAENAIWHGLMHKKGIANLEIQLCVENKILTCTIIDNGIGRNMAASFKSRSAEKNKSMGVNITAGRLALLNKSKNEAVVFNIEDLVDEKGNGCGTKVILSIPYKELTEVIA